MLRNLPRLNQYYREAREKEYLSESISSVGWGFLLTIRGGIKYLLEQYDSLIRKGGWTEEEFSFIEEYRDEMKNQWIFTLGFIKYVQRHDTDLPIDSLLPLMYSSVFFKGEKLFNGAYPMSRMPKPPVTEWKWNGSEKVTTYCNKVFGSDPWIWYEKIRRRYQPRRMVEIIDDSREDDGRINLGKIEYMWKHIHSPFSLVLADVEKEFKLFLRRLKR